MAMRSATRSSLIMSASESPSTYSAWLRVASPSGEKFGAPPLVRGVLGELGDHAFGMDAFRHEVVALVAQDADDLGGERFVQELHDDVAVGVVPGSNRAFRDVLPG